MLNALDVASRDSDGFEALVQIREPKMSACFSTSILFSVLFKVNSLVIMKIIIIVGVLLGILINHSFVLHFFLN